MFEELSLHILDIGMNAMAAGAKTLQVVVYEDYRHDLLLLRVRDDGRGMSGKMLEKVLHRGISTKTSRKKPIGLGLALLRQTAEMCEGAFRVRSKPGVGTTVTASMRLSHVDRPPLGDLSATILALCVANPKVDVQLHFHMDGQHLKFSSQQLNEQRSNHGPRPTQKTQREGAAAGRAA